MAEPAGGRDGLCIEAIEEGLLEDGGPFLERSSAALEASLDWEGDFGNTSLPSKILVVLLIASSESPNLAQS